MRTPLAAATWPESAGEAIAHVDQLSLRARRGPVRARRAGQDDEVRPATDRSATRPGHAPARPRPPSRPATPTTSPDVRARSSHGDARPGRRVPSPQWSAFGGRTTSPPTTEASQSSAGSSRKPSARPATQSSSSPRPARARPTSSAATITGVAPIAGPMSARLAAPPRRTDVVRPVDHLTAEVPAVDGTSVVSTTCRSGALTTGSVRPPVPNGPGEAPGRPTAEAGPEESARSAELAKGTRCRRDPRNVGTSANVR